MSMSHLVKQKLTLMSYIVFFLMILSIMQMKKLFHQIELAPLLII